MSFLSLLISPRRLLHCVSRNLDLSLKQQQQDNKQDATKEPSSVAVSVAIPAAAPSSSATPDSAQSKDPTGDDSRRPDHLDSVPFIVTIISRADASVLYQNQPSKVYHGDLAQQGPVGMSSGRTLLDDLFSFADDKDSLMAVRSADHACTHHLDTEIMQSMQS